MFGTNKKVMIQRISSNGVFTNYTVLKCRYSPKKFSSVKELETKQNHITFNLFCDSSTITIKDKVIDGSRSFTISGISEYSDNFGKHLEVLMVENNSRLHENIDIVSLSGTQNNYDSMIGEWIGSKATSTKTVKALVDSAKLMRNKFITMTEGGKVEDVEWVVTLFYPENIAKSDKIVYNGSTYEIKWIIPFPHQLAVGITKYIKDYEA